MPNNYIWKTYNILLADPQRAPQYTEGNTSGEYPVFGTAQEMRGRFSALFMKPTIDTVVPLWHVDDTTVLFTTRRDRELPDAPLCFGKLMVVGQPVKVEALETRLRTQFPNIDKLTHTGTY